MKKLIKEWKVKGMTFTYIPSFNVCGIEENGNNILITDVNSELKAKTVSKQLEKLFGNLPPEATTMSLHLTYDDFVNIGNGDYLMNYINQQLCCNI